MSEDATLLAQAEHDVRSCVGDQPFDFESMALISNICRAASDVRNHVEQNVLGDHDMSWAAFTVMFVVWVWGEQETRHLAAETGVTKGTLTGVLKTLERRGFVRRVPHPVDGRRVVVHLEPSGAEVLEELLPRLNEHGAFLSSSLSEAERSQVTSMLRAVIRTVGRDTWAVPAEERAE